jgi:hypothetical protein
MTFCMLHVLVVVFWEATMNCLCSSNCITCINKTNIKTKMAHCLNSFCAIFGTVRTVCYFWNCSDSVLFLELFRQCAIFGTVQTVCYFWNCSDSVLFLELFRQCAWLAYLSFIVSLFWCSNVWTNDLRNTLFVINLSNIVMALCTLLLLSSVIYDCSDSVLFLELFR